MKVLYALEEVEGREMFLNLFGRIGTLPRDITKCLAPKQPLNLEDECLTV